MIFPIFCPYLQYSTITLVESKSNLIINNTMMIDAMSAKKGLASGIKLPMELTPRSSPDKASGVFFAIFLIVFMNLSLKSTYLNACS